MFGTDRPLNTRDAAMKLPALARARNLLVSTICRVPLVALTGQTLMPETEQPAWLTATGDGTSPQIRLAWTIDDLMFSGWSCWARTNDEDGNLVTASRLNLDDWTINDDMRVEVYGSVVPDTDVIIFCGLHEGILQFGNEVIADATDLYRNVRARIRNPVPQLNLHQTAGDPMTPEQIDSLIDRWSAARQGKNAGVSYTNQSIEVNELGGGGDAALMIDARNASAVDLARLAGVAAGRVDASGVNSTLTYETKEGRNQELVDFDLQLYTTPISARLSMDDVMPAGQRVDFDFGDFTAPAPSAVGPNLQD